MEPDPRFGRAPADFQSLPKMRGREGKSVQMKPHPFRNTDMGSAWFAPSCHCLRGQLGFTYQGEMKWPKTATKSYFQSKIRKEGKEIRRNRYPSEPGRDISRLDVRNRGSGAGPRGPVSRTEHVALRGQRVIDLRQPGAVACTHATRERFKTSRIGFLTAGWL